MDGETDGMDRAIIKANLGQSCISLCQRADLDRKGRVDSRDVSLLRASAGETKNGACDQALCTGDLNGDARVGRADIRLMSRAERTCGIRPARK